MNYKKAWLIAIIIIGIWAVKAGVGQVRSIHPVSVKVKSKWGLGSTFNSAPILRVNSGSQKLLALTFDDGPDERFTPMALDILEKHNIKATFFVIGQTAEAHPDLVKRAAVQGHEIANHTYTHPDLTTTSIAQTQEEIVRAGDVIEGITGKKPQYFRPPKGYYKPDTLILAASNGYSVALWSICVEHSSCVTVNDLAQRVISAVEPGMIILAHDGRLDRSRTMQALPIIIEACQKQGYRFVTMDELINSRVQNQKLRSVSRFEFITGMLAQN